MECYMKHPYLLTHLVSYVLFLLTRSTSSARNVFAETYTRIQYSSLLHCLSVMNVLGFSKMGQLVLQVGCITSSETVPADRRFWWSCYFWKSVAFRIPCLNVASLFFWVILNSRVYKNNCYVFEDLKANLQNETANIHVLTVHRCQWKVCACIQEVVHFQHLL